MSRYRAANLASTLFACAAFAIGTANCAQASTVEHWTGRMALPPTKSPSPVLRPINCPALLETALTRRRVISIISRWSEVPVNTAFSLELKLNGTWTTVSTWTLDSLNNVKLSTLTTPINFATSTVSGIELTASPNYSGNNYNDMNLSLYDDCGRDGVQETFTFNNVATTPLPATLPLLAGGLGFVGFLARRRKGSAEHALAAA